MSFRPARDYRWDSVGDTVEHIEQFNCSKGCDMPRTLMPEYGPGGDCGILALVVLEEEVEDITDDGRTLTCHARIRPRPDDPMLPFE